MKVFLSSTFRDLRDEREAVLRELQKRSIATKAMEYFVASPSTTQETALAALRDSDVMVLLLGFKAGSLLPDGSGGTYTSAEYEELLAMGKEPLVFLREDRRWLWSRTKTWHNLEKRKDERKALDAFKAAVGARWTWDRFSTPDQLALGVIQALDRWEANGRPGARKTFASASVYFQGKSPAGHFQILDFDTTLLGRDKEIRALGEFLNNPSKRVCILSGRGGIGKSKILYDWAKLNPGRVIFLKDGPLWHADSEKEIPIDANMLVVDDAHRQESLPKLLQLFNEVPARQNIKLILSTRPGSASRISQEVFRMKVDPAQVTQLPELQELSRDESRALAEQVLGDSFSRYANHLADVSGYSPLVIVAGGHLIATRKVDPSTLTSIDQFRSTIFNSFLDEMNLRGPQFPIDPPRPLLELIAAIGPVEVNDHTFQKLVESFLNRPIDEVLKTFDALAENGIITPRHKPVRIIPDVLSDFIIEDRCIGSGGRSTHYADRVYSHFGAHSLKELMRNLAELDWRRTRSGDSGLNLLDSIWADIHQRFQSGDEYIRHGILDDLASAAIYQPSHVLRLIRMAIASPIEVVPSSERSHFRVGQNHVLSALPSLLEATAHHAERLPESLTILWELAKMPGSQDRDTGGAQSVIKRLASWSRYGHPAINFAMLLQAVRLAQRPDAFTGEFTPYAIIKEILEREGEFSEWQDENAMSIGSFGLNYAAVGPVRESTLDYLEFAVAGDGRPAYLAVGLLEELLFNYLRRMGRGSSEEEDRWQNNERKRSLAMLLARYNSPKSPLLEAHIYGAIRSATAIQCPPAIRESAQAALANLPLTDTGAIVDAICTATHELPMLEANFDSEEQERAGTALTQRARSSLERIAPTATTRAKIIIDQVVSCISARVKTNGFAHFVSTLRDDRSLLCEIADQIEAHPQKEDLSSQLSAILHAVHIVDPAEFRRRAQQAIRNDSRPIIIAAANNLRVWEGATREDVELIQIYGQHPDPIVRGEALFAIAYMGKFIELRILLKDAALAIDPLGNEYVSDKLTDAFGPYGIPLTMLRRSEVEELVSKFLPVENWDAHQHAIPRFLNRLTPLFPDEAFGLLEIRIARGIKEGRTNLRLRSLDPLDANISFSGVPLDKRIELGRRCIDLLMKSEHEIDIYCRLFWTVAGYDDAALELVLAAAASQSTARIVGLIERAIPRLAFDYPTFAKRLIQRFQGDQRREIVDAFAHQAGRLGGGSFAGGFEEMVAERSKEYDRQLATLPKDPEIHDLFEALEERRREE